MSTTADLSQPSPKRGQRAEGIRWGGRSVTIVLLPCWAGDTKHVGISAIFHFPFSSPHGCGSSRRDVDLGVGYVCCPCLHSPCRCAPLDRWIGTTPQQKSPLLFRIPMVLRSSKAKASKASLPSGPILCLGFVDSSRSRSIPLPLPLPLPSRRGTAVVFPTVRPAASANEPSGAGFCMTCTCACACTCGRVDKAVTCHVVRTNKQTNKHHAVMSVESRGSRLTCSFCSIG